jgi:hypothetical protein
MTVETKVVTRLAPEVYASLVQKCPAIAVTNDTSEMQAGFQLGVQYLLKLLREGFVAG